MSTKLRALLAVLAAALMISGSGLTIGTASATGPGDQVCTGLDSGKIDTTGDPSSVTVTAPDGKLIDGYCVKAGSSNQGDGPVYVTVDPPQKSVTISYPGGKAVSHYSVSYTDDVPAQPDSKVTYSEWVDGDKSCESKTVTQTREKTVTPYTWNGTEWVLDTANAVKTTETQTRPMTEAELKECSGSQPDSKVTYSDWVEGAPNCESKTVTKTRTKTVTPYKWNGTEWVLDTANATSTTETETRPLTEAELKACEGTPPPDDSCPPLTGSVKTTLADGSVVNGNIYTDKNDVYVYGDQLGDVTTVYIRVTDPSGSVVLSATKTVTVTDGSFGPVQLPTFADTPNNGGEYKVWVSSSTDFEQSCTKSDNFKVKGEEPPPPTSVTPDKPSATLPNCQQPNITVTPGSQPGVVWSPAGTTVLEPGESVTYVATPAKDYEFPKGAQTSWTFTNTFDVKACEEEPTPVSPTEPTQLEKCEPATGPTEDRINGLSDANFTYQVDGVVATTSSFVATGTSHIVTAIAKPGVVVKAGAKTSWPFTFTKVQCATSTPTPTTPVETPTTPTETPTTPTETPSTPTETPTPEIGTPTSTSVPTPTVNTPTATPTFVPPSAGGGDWPPADFGSSDYSFAGMMGKLLLLGGLAIFLLLGFERWGRRKSYDMA